MSTLEQAIIIAAAAHKGALDKGGAPYILHPLRVMAAVNTLDEKIVAVLHDVVEDSKDWTFDKLLAEGFSSQVVDALRCVTKTSKDEDYEAFIERALGNAIATQVKLADLRDNSDLSRLPQLNQDDLQRLAKYHRAIRRIQAALAQGQHRSP